MRNRRNHLVIAGALMLFISSIAARQTAAPPATNIFVAELSVQNGKWKVVNPINITDRDGYNNQPFFTPNGKSILYTSIREDKQADIYRYDLVSKTDARVTNTKESEYSPTLTPDGKGISVIRVEPDNTQRLWRFNLNGDDPSVILENIKPVGYHAWIDGNTLALFVLGSPSTLQIVDVKTQHAETVASDIGRSLFKIPHQEKVSFTHKISNNMWEIDEYDLKSRKTSIVAKSQPGNEYYAWSPSGVLVTANDAKLFKLQPGKDSDWVEIADLSSSGIKSITRIAISPSNDRIAFVTSRGK
ncbi:MAG TPA: hypothetical protein VFC63_06770 [Blastocatellia bacterium]|nr:hypothetical protein [Blastocatellia bacterium]